MNCKVLSIVRSPPDELVIAELQKLLDDAKAGELVSFSGVAEYKNSDVAYLFLGRWAASPFYAALSLQRLIGKISA